MKKQHFSKASMNLLGLLLVLSMLGATLHSGLGNISNLMDAIHNQWSNFAERLIDLNPHRSVFPE
ncbi:MAG TPA: hypothetical protein PKL15_11980 [Saprospiraceae bacterium]|nr:hypothetical protein [Saprospiraceae bacterium]HNM26146.1 hypothetical protein [Saprospiraceae bacterium]